MDSRKRILVTLERGKPDRPAWFEPSFHPKVASVILGEKVESTGSGFFPMEDGKAYEVELEKWIKLAKRINLDCLGLKLYGPSLAGEKGESFSGGTIKNLKDFEEMINNPPPYLVKEENFLSCAPILIKRTEEEGIASFFITHFGFENVLEGIGFEDFCYALFDNKELIERMLDFYKNIYLKIIHLFMELKPDFIMIGDDLAFGQGPFVPPNLWEELFMPRFSALAKKIICPWIYHSDGNLMPIMDSLLSLGMNALNPIEPYGTMDIKEVKERYGNRVCLCGNLDMNIIANGTPSDIEKEIKWLYRNVGYNGGWMLSSSNTIDKGANPENVIAMGQTIANLLKIGTHPI